jgi:hypothetical protein
VRDFQEVEAQRRVTRQQRHQADLDAASAARASGLPAPAPRPPAMSPEVRAAMTANANQALKQYADPETRRGLIDYYRAIGIELDENA